MIGFIAPIQWNDRCWQATAASMLPPERETGTQTPPFPLWEARPQMPAVTWLCSRFTGKVAQRVFHRVPGSPLDRPRNFLDGGEEGMGA